jgi:glutamine---fructose-6-phosphate transaminase (isomerizing)
LSAIKDFVNRRAVSVETMLKAIQSQVALVPGVILHVEPQVREVVARLDPNTLTNVFTTGCGDSLYAATATRLAFEKYSGYRTEAIEALEFSRYTVDYLAAGSLVLSVSSGGHTSRPVEALVQARRRGATAIAITGDQQSPLAGAADHTVVQNEREFTVPAPPNEGTFRLGNYMASMLSLYLLAFELGVSSGRITEGDKRGLIDQLNSAAGIIDATISENAGAARAYAREVVDKEAFQILGAGPSYGTALFMAAKLFEMPQLQGVPQELEEWAHEQYFLIREGVEVLVVAPPGMSVDRAREQIAGIRDMGGHAVAICDHNDQVTRGSADIAFPIAGTLPEEFSPLAYSIPGQLFAAELSRALGKPAFAFISPRQYEVNMRQIHDSELRE